jgi:hypothetical protein
MDASGHLAGNQVTGLGKVLANEESANISCRFIDLDPKQELQQNLKTVVKIVSNAHTYNDQGTFLNCIIFSICFLNCLFFHVHRIRYS